MSTIPRVSLPPGTNTTSLHVQGEVLAYHVPDIHRRRQTFFKAISATDVVDAATKEVVRIRNARVTGCEY